MPLLSTGVLVDQLHPLLTFGSQLPVVKIHPPDFPDYDKEMPMTSENSRLSTLSCLLPPLLHAYLTLTPIPISTIIIALEAYILPNHKDHSPTFCSDLSLFHSLRLSPSLTLAHVHPLPQITFYLASLVLADGTNTFISLLLPHTQKTLVFHKCT